MKPLFLTVAFTLFRLFVPAQQLSRVWVADRGDGTYQNPILFADYSDPDAVRVGNDYYMTASSFNCTPGLPILHSTDLVNWELIGHALPNQIPEEVYDKPQHGNGVWAPAIRWHKGLYYIYYPDPDYGIYVITAKDAAGPWSKPTLVVGGKGLIDPCPLFGDADAGPASHADPDHARPKVWLVNGWAASRAGVNSLLTVRALSPDGMRALGEGRMVFDGHDQDPTLEGPKFYRRNGYYYILAPAGGVTGGWQLALRSKNIFGPYERKVVMDQGSTGINGPHQGAWVETQTGTDWFIHFQDRGPYGRVTLLEPMVWKNDWPVIGVDKDGDGKGEPVSSWTKPFPEKHPLLRTPPTSDEFNGDAPGLQWQWHANPQITWSAEIPGSGRLRLFAIRRPENSSNLWEVPNLLLQKLPAPAFQATTVVSLTASDAGKMAGLLVMGDDYSYLAIKKEESGLALVQVVCANAEKGGEERTLANLPLSVNRVFCRVEITPPDAACRYSYSLDGQHWQPIGSVCIPKPDKWIGAKVGLFCLSPANARNGGYADFDWFHIDPADPDAASHTPPRRNEGAREFTIDLDRREGTFQPAWASFGYDEPNFTYMRDGRKLLSELAALSPVPVYVRCHNLLTTGDGTPALKWGSTNAYTEDAQGRPVYDWHIVDSIFDTYIQRKMHPLAEIGFMPEAMSVHPEPYRHFWRPGIRYDSIYTGWAWPPKDYAKWSELIYRWVRHCVERYGKEEVDTWRWEVWNEPNISYWKGSEAEYIKLYDYTADAVKRALPTAKIGGPATTGPGWDKAAQWLKDFLTHCAGGVNAVTGAKGAPLDFISFHAKGSPRIVDGHVRMNMAPQLKDAGDGFSIVKASAFAALPIYITECDPEGCAACGMSTNPENAYRNGTMYSSYTAASFAHIYDLANQYKVNLAGLTSWSFEFEGQKWFDGFRDLATNGVDKPVLNVFRMFGMMQGDRVRIQRADAMSDSARGVDQEIGTLAVTDDRTTSIMVWNYDRDDLPGEEAQISLRVSHIRGDKVRVQHYRIDEAHSNAYTVWKQMGSPQEPDRSQYERLEKAGALEPVTPPIEMAAPGGTAIIQFSLPKHGVSLVRVSAL